MNENGTKVAIPNVGHKDYTWYKPDYPKAHLESGLNDVDGVALIFSNLLFDSILHPSFSNLIIFTKLWDLNLNSQSNI